MKIEYPEMWGGIECTLNRVGDTYFDQLDKNGHYTREKDLELFASLGIKKLRYPILWERIAPENVEKANWEWADQQLEKLRNLAITPIVGFVHHGSGPNHTSLVSECFPEKLAEFAGAFAKRYPWVEYYTPINEPLTTARFSALYGHWYPHTKDEKTFVEALFTETKGTIESMREIRKINPQAKLVQTEDLGKVYSTPTMAYQAKFENDRRWLSLDLLTGRLTPQRRLWYYFTYLGITEKEMSWFMENTFPPDIIGINHYLTSERFLDENIEAYPASTHGKNEFNTYADVEALRVCKEGSSGHYHLLKEAWERYHIPLAITEVHLHCKREEQLRWFKQAWDLSVLLLNEGVDVRGVTAWALLGSFNWCNLVTKDEGKYETGVFDIRNGIPRATALAEMIKNFSEGRNYEHPVLEIPGWWKRPSRFIYPVVSVSEHDQNREPEDSDLKKIYNKYFRDLTKSELEKKYSNSTPLLIIGGEGRLGKAFQIICRERAIPYRALSREEFNISNSTSAIKIMEKINPWAIVNCAGFTDIDAAEKEKEQCDKINIQGAINLAEIAATQGIQFISYSSDQVFDGQKRALYVESDQPFPLNIFGKSKEAAEKQILTRHKNALIIRTGRFFDPWGLCKWTTDHLKKIAKGESLVLDNHHIFTAGYLPDLVNASIDLLIDKEKGIWHLTNPGETTEVLIVSTLTKNLRFDVELIHSRRTKSIVHRPVYTALSSERGVLLPSLESALGHLSDVLHKTLKKQRIV
jgi:dTDP-4-dehydrorhamnose reductase